MDTFLFQAGLCLQGMRRQIKLNCVVVLSLCIGMFVPLAALADIEYFVRYGETARAAFPDSAAYFYSASQRYETEEIYERLSKNPKLEEAAVAETTGRTLEYRREEFFQQVLAVSEEYFSFYPPVLLEGRGIEEGDYGSPDRICLVETNFFADKGREGTVGEKIRMDGEEYRIVGICRKINSRGAVWIPWNPAEYARDGDRQLRVLVRYPAAVSLSEAEEEIRPLFEELNSFGTLLEEYERSRESGFRLCASILLLVLPLIVFSMMNCFAVIQGKIRRMRYRFALEMACGAGRRALFRECMLENLILCGIALLLDLALTPLVSAWIPEKFVVVWDGRVYLEMFLILLAVCVVISRLSVRSILKIGLAETLKNR
ncbi:MAG: ABC transporter permease [Roseburia sp.]|nr:ABC transporter permease [Roseburia sp.]MCM1097962.1 ABC transporter permease [Ruminococcus flavefaciens]